MKTQAFALSCLQKYPARCSGSIQDKIPTSFKCLRYYAKHFLMKCNAASLPQYPNTQLTQFTNLILHVYFSLSTARNKVSITLIRPKLIRIQSSSGGILIYLILLARYNNKMSLKHLNFCVVFKSAFKKKTQFLLQVALQRFLFTLLFLPDPNQRHIFFTAFTPLFSHAHLLPVCSDSLPISTVTPFTKAYRSLFFTPVKEKEG